MAADAEAVVALLCSERDEEEKTGEDGPRETSRPDRELHGERATDRGSLLQPFTRR
jgi:hypothetical protein